MFTKLLWILIVYGSFRCFRKKWSPAAGYRCFSICQKLYIIFLWVCDSIIHILWLKNRELNHLSPYGWLQYIVVNVTNLCSSSFLRLTSVESKKKNIHFDSSFPLCVWFVPSYFEPLMQLEKKILRSNPRGPQNFKLLLIDPSEPAILLHQMAKLIFIVIKLVYWIISL